ncbi:MAG: PD-(D/E)XK nuclease family protein [Polyangiaceae bacterium]
MESTDSWLLVPSERHVEALAAAGSPATTLRKLVSVLASLEAPGLTATTQETSRLLCAELLGCSASQAQVFDDAVGRLRRAGTRVESLRESRAARARRFAELLQGADHALAARRLRDERQGGWLAARAVAQGRFEAASGRLLVRGLTRWDASTLALLEALHGWLRAQGGEGVSLELPEHSLGPLSAATQALASELEARWAHENDHPTLVFEPSVALEPERVTLVEALDVASEARAAARAVLDALARGVALERIAIVPADLSEAFLEPLRFELQRARIPFVEPRGRPAIAAPRAHAALELMRLARGPLTRDALVDLLRVPGIRLERWFGDASASQLAHELSRLPIRVERSEGDLVSELELRIGRAEGERKLDLGPLRGARDGLSRFLTELRGLGGAAPRSTHARRFRELFDEMRLLTSSPSELSHALSRDKHGQSELLLGLGYDAVAQSAVQSATERALGAANALGLSQREVTLETWIDELELALHGVAPSRGAARAAAVRVARPDEVACLELGVVVLCRASDATLDRPLGPDSTLGIELENELPRRERPLSATIEQHFATLSVASALARAESVVVTWARRDESSTSLLPSRLARSLSARSSVRREPASPLSPDARRAAQLKPASPGASERTRVDLSRSAFYADPEAPSDALNGEAGELGAFFGTDAQHPVAITSIERGLRCAFLAFSNQVLRASRLDPVGDAIGVRERGSLLHDALAAALEANSQTAELTPAELVELGVAAAARLLTQRGQSPLRKVGLDATLADVRAVLSLLAHDADGASFRFAEHTFGNERSWPALALGGFLVSGRIDRVDATADGRRVRVIDYKTRTPTRADDALSLQPWLYAEKAGVELGASEVEFCFVGVDGRNPSARVVYRGEIDGGPIVEAKQRALTVLNTLSQGHVAARPASSAFCPRCDARDICRRPLSSPEGAEE